MRRKHHLRARNYEMTGNKPGDYRNTKVYLGLDSVNDEPWRRRIWERQRIHRGFDDTELWNLGSTIAEYAVPRLKAFKKIMHGYPGLHPFETFEEWEDGIDEMIYALEAQVADDTTDLDLGDPDSRVKYEKDADRIEEGLMLFARYMGFLWD